LDRGILIPNSKRLAHILDSHSESMMSKYVTDLVETQRRAIEVAREIQTSKDTEHKSSGNTAITEFENGTLVTLSYPQNQDGVSKPPSKLLTKRRGPYTILSHSGPTYQIRTWLTTRSHQSTSVAWNNLFTIQHEWTLKRSRPRICGNS